MSNYPGSIVSPREKENRYGVVFDSNKKQVIYVEDIQLLDDEVVAIETELGVNVKGEHADLATRLAWIESQLP